MDDDVESLAETPDGGLIAGGERHAGSRLVGNIARFDGTRWSYLGSSTAITGGDETVYEVAVLADGSLVATGRWSLPLSSYGVARFNGTSWQ